MGKEHDILVLRLHATLDAQHLLEGILVAMLYLERFPHRPVIGFGAGIAELRRVGVDGSCAVNLAESSFHLGKLDAHVLGLLVRKQFDGSLVDRPGRGQAKVCRRLGDVEGENVDAVFVRNLSARSVVDPHGVPRETARLLQIAVHEIKHLAELRRTAVDGLLEQITKPLHVHPTVDGFREIQIPQLECDGVAEEFETPLIDLRHVSTARGFPNPKMEYSPCKSLRSSGVLPADLHS